MVGTLPRGLHILKLGTVKSGHHSEGFPSSLSSYCDLHGKLVSTSHPLIPHHIRKEAGSLGTGPKACLHSFTLITRSELRRLTVTIVTSSLAVLMGSIKSKSGIHCSCLNSQSHDQAFQAPAAMTFGQ